MLLAVAETGSLTGAARQLDVTTAAVSAAIKRIEESLGARLFERTTRALRATAEGAVLIEHARQALDIVAKGQAAVRSGAHDIGGRISITTSAMLGREVVVKWIAQFADRHPAVEIDLQVSDQQADLVRDGFDVALRNGPLGESGMAARLLAPARRVACAAPGYLLRHGSPQHPRDLAGHECLVTRARGRLYDRWTFAPLRTPAQKSEVRVKGRLCAHDASTAFLWALEGRGITYQSQLVVADALQRGALVRVLPDFAGDEVPLYAVLPNNHLIPIRVSVLLAELSAHFLTLQA